ncbi:MAG: hypothetical protein JWO51_2321 [Rhodospirillales bacterium]|nr:hypothetical protein [Rhodospirillales bacterium]
MTAAPTAGIETEDELRNSGRIAKPSSAGAISAEFGLLIACCRWPPSAGRNAAIRAAAARPIDWAHFERVVKRHRVAGLVWHGLSHAGIEVPETAGQVLQNQATVVARGSLALCAETLRLQRLFDQAALHCAQVKGSTLAMLAYGNLAIRHAKDIDLVVLDAEFSAVCALLETAGYERQRPPPGTPDAVLSLWRRFNKDMEWRHRGKNIELEVHWRLTNISSLADEGVDFTALQPVKVSSSAIISTLPPAQLFIYLCVHGASHAWNRLKWLTDIQALLADKSAIDIETYYRLARNTGTHRAVGQALLLCADMFGLELPPDLARALRRSCVTRLLSRLALLCMTRGKAETEIYQLPFGTTLVSASHFLLASTPHAFMTEIGSKSINLDDMLNLPLPGKLTFLYRVLRWPLWLHRRWQNAGK